MFLRRGFKAKLIHVFACDAQAVGAVGGRVAVLSAAPEWHLDDFLSSAVARRFPDLVVLSDRTLLVRLDRDCLKSNK